MKDDLRWYVGSLLLLLILVAEAYYWQCEDALTYGASLPYHPRGQVQRI